MHPALSVIAFTVVSGVGYGVLILLALARPLELLPGLDGPRTVVLASVALVLVTAGLVCSTFHLAKPSNAWRAFTRVRSSWLSREAVAAVAVYPLAIGWLTADIAFDAPTLASTFAALTALMALATLFCTGMIYASLKTIRAWHHPLVPVNMILLGLAPGALLLLASHGHDLPPAERLHGLALAFVGAAAIGKLVHWYWIGLPSGTSLNTAFAITRARIRLLDVGHAADTFHTREFGYAGEGVPFGWLRIGVLLIGFAKPLLLLSLASDPGPLQYGFATLALISATAVERWLFFAEARHTMTLYHGAQTSAPLAGRR